MNGDDAQLLVFDDERDHGERDSIHGGPVDLPLVSLRVLQDRLLSVLKRKEYVSSCAALLLCLIFCVRRQLNPLVGTEPADQIKGTRAGREKSTT